jgi:hypothetical protein
MLKFLTVHKKKVLFFVIFALLIVSINFNLFSLKDFLYKKYPNLSLHKEFRSTESLKENIKNDYNAVFLPKTQYEKLSLIKNKINFQPKHYKRFQSTKSGIAVPSYGSFFLEIYNENIWIVDYLGDVYKINKDKINYKKARNITPEIIETNFSSKKVLDILTHDEKIYISSANKEGECKTLEIHVAKINLKKLNFKNFFKAKECGDLILAGRMQFYKHNNSEGIIFTTHGHLYNKPDKTPQNDNSIYGKILFVDFADRKPIVFSKGHRLSQGLFANNNLILQTEHGPRGGDEINKIIFQKNYGWPEVSYGEKYGLGFTKKPSYKKNHYKNGFEEPVYSFVPSIGISEIIKLPNTFSKHFQNNFILSSLNGHNLYRVKFDELFERVIYLEKIFIGERVRDLKFHDKLNIIILAFEENGEIGIISNDFE